MTTLCYFIMIAADIFIICLIGKTDMLRDNISNVDAFNQARQQIATNSHKALNKVSKKATFSLGRTQLAFWTLIISNAFVYIWVNSDFISVPAITATTLALLGIAAGTTLVAKNIDDSQASDCRSPNTPSINFITDITSDEKGPSIHRLQNVIWTVVVGAIYIGFVINKNQLPDKDTITPNLLGLMGISAGAYLGLKTNENKPGSAGSDDAANTPPGNGNNGGAGNTTCSPATNAGNANAGGAGNAVAASSTTTTEDDVEADKNMDKLNADQDA